MTTDDDVLKYVVTRSDRSIGSLLDSAPIALGVCLSRAAALGTPHLARVGLTFGMLHTVREFFRFANDGADDWRGYKNSLSILNKEADKVAKRVLDVVEKQVPDIFPLFLRQTDRFEPFRHDLRFSEPLAGDTTVPFSDDFPNFGPDDMGDIAEQIGDATGVMLGVLPTVDALPAKEQLTKSRDNFVEIVIYYMALGKSVLTYWTPIQIAFLDWLVCMVLDYEMLDPTEKVVRPGVLFRHRLRRPLQQRRPR